LLRFSCIVEAWELAIRARPLVESHARDNAMSAKQMLNKALELDENYTAASIGLGWIYWEESVWEWSSNPKESMQMAFDVGQNAISVDANYPDGYSLLGHVCMSRGDTNQAIAMTEKAVELAPSDSGNVALLADILFESGRIEESIRKIQRAIRLSPFPPAWYLCLLGTCFHISGDNETAVSALEHAVEREPDSHLARVWLASTLADMGRLDQAHAIAEAVIAIDPAFSVSKWTKSYSSKAHARLKDNLLAAGLPD